VRAEQLDRFYRLADVSILHLEFQTTVDEDDLPRFYRTQFAAGEYYDTQVHTVVLYGAGITSAPDTLHRSSAIYRVRQVFLGTQDGEMVVAIHLLEVLRMANALEKLIEDTLVRGREEGRAEGEVEGFRKAVRLAVEQRFAYVPPALAAQLDAADEPKLARMLNRLQTADRVDDVLSL
jgi:hypothetical protein